ncbi:putative uncharacterized protein [Prevotella sp. CAG:474]|nr:putative uncharacterized protein [Prevotella sp. CAG:474]
MKKTLLFLIAATAMMMAGCSNDDFGGATQGMTLNATVEQPASRATMAEGEKSTYKFSFAVNDMLNVTNSQVESFYTFTKTSDTFTSSDAKTTTAPADWYAYFPGNTVDLTKQNGDLAGVANYYACAGKTASATTGADGLNITLTPQVAILRIVKVDGNSTTCDINVKTGEKWVSGLTAKSNEAGFDVVTSDTKVTLLTASEPGTYYIAVPAGVQITIYNGDTKFKATKAAGLKAGMYYTVTTGDVTGKANATIGSVTKEIGWVQLWAGGPKFATQNVAGTMTWTAAKENTFWGPNWRVPTKDEMGLSANYTVNTEKVSAVYRCNENGVWGFEFTGVTPGYTNVSLFLPANPGALDSRGEATYWTATPVGPNQAGYQLSLIGGGNYVHNCHYAAFGHDGVSYVRPVLVEK